jgi:hypothetical protein
MTAETRTHVNPEDHFDVHGLMARWTASSRQAAERLLDVYEQTVGQFAEAHVQSARQTNLPAIVTLAETQATLTRNTADAYVRSIRNLLEL